MQAYFRPELLNRLDEIVVFKQLAMFDTAAIAELLMQETRERIAVRGIGLEVSSSLMRFICQEGYSEVRNSLSPSSEDRYFKMRAMFRLMGLCTTTHGMAGGGVHFRRQGSDQ